MTRFVVAVLLLIATGLPLLADHPAGHPRDPRVVDAKLPALAEFKTVDTAVTTRVSRSIAEPGQTGQPGYLGFSLDANGDGALVVSAVAVDSPAAKAGIQVGDQLVELGGQRSLNAGFVGDYLRSKAPGDALTLGLSRQGRGLEVTATLGATSRPLSASGQRPSIGVTAAEAANGAKVERVVTGSPADTAGIKAGDIIVRFDSETISSPEKLTAAISDKRIGESVTLLLKRDNKDLTLTVRVAANTEQERGRFRGWDERQMGLWKKDVYRLALVGIEYPDVKHNAKVSTWDYEQAHFSTRIYNDKSATGQQVYGSMNDYYLEQSCGKFRVEGKMFDWVEVKKKRAEYANDPNRFALLTEALDKILARDGKDALKEFDGVFFMYAGERYSTVRGGLYWPHRASLSHGGRRWAYFICPEGGARMNSISVNTHEFGHMLGLPDLYAKPENPGSEGLGIWCTMATGHGRDGKPLHMSAWCKEQLGWLTPTVIDPTTKQRLVLAPIENSPRECFKVLIRPDGSEYLLLENRVAKNYDRDIPGEGLLIWRIVDGRPVLEESHGIAGPDGPGRFLGAVPYPSKSNNAFTPYTTPSSRSQKGGGLPVHITNIQKLPDGRVTLQIGYEYF